jgi:archaellum biogenesis protein FlaJ (TadC family)
VDIADGQTGVVSYNNESSQNFGLLMKDLVELYTNLSIEFDPIDASDYMPFEARGSVCIGAYMMVLLNQVMFTIMVILM